MTEPRPVAGDQLPMVGRADELEVLTGALADRSTVILIEGEVGIGKTRLLQAVLAETRRRAVMAYCPPLPEPFPLGPLIDALRRACPGGIAGLKLSPLAGALLPLFPEWRESLPAAPEPLTDVGAVRHRLFRALDELLSVLEPDVLIVEDAHWADQATLEFLLFRWARPESQATLVLTYRPEEVLEQSLLHRLAANRHGCDTPLRMVLRPFTPEQVREQITHILDTASVSTAFAECLHQHTAGIPYMVEEAINLLRDRADIERRQHVWVRRALEKLSVPDTIRGSILERVKRMKPSARRVLGAAAVLGRPEAEAVLAKVAGLAPAQFYSGMEQASASGLLSETEVGRFQVRHTLAEKAIYEAMPMSARRAAHRRAVAALERRKPLPVADLARHSKHAADMRRWARYAELSAEHATAAGDQRTAMLLLYEILNVVELPVSRRYRLAVKLGEATAGGGHMLAEGGVVKEIIDCLRRIAGSTGLGRAQRSRVSLYIGFLIMHYVDPNEGRAILMGTLDGLEATPMPAIQALLKLCYSWTGDRPVIEYSRWLARVDSLKPRLKRRVDRVTVTMQSAKVRLRFGDMQGWAELSGVGTGEREEPAVQRTLAKEYINLSYAALAWGRNEQAAAWLNMAEELVQATEYWPMHDFLQINRAWLFFYSGSWDDLASVLEHLMASATVSPLLRREINLLKSLSMLVSGDISKGTQALTSAMSEYQGSGYEDVLLSGAAALARLRLYDGRPLDALALTRGGIRQIEASGLWVWAAEIISVHVEALIMSGDADQARLLTNAMAAGLRGCIAPAPRAAVLVCRGLLALHHNRETRPEDRNANAAALFARAARMWALIPRPHDELLALERQALCMLNTGKHEAALDLFKEVEARQSRLGAQRDADRVARVLREHDVAIKRVWRRGRKSYGKRLSPRELKVVQLVASGQTNKQIAGVLYLTQSTVSGHVSAAMRKLGVDSRTALALAAVRQGLISEGGSE